MTRDEQDDIKILQDEIEQEIVALRALIPNPRMLEMFSVMAWRADPDEEEQGWITLALATARRIRAHQEYQSHSTQA